MAKIWEVHGTTQRDRPIAIRPWLECKKLLELDEYNRTEDRPRFGEGNTGFFSSNIVVQIEDDEAREHGIEPAYYNSPLTPNEAKARLGLS